MALTIGSGLASFGENFARGRQQQLDNKRQASQDILKASQQQFTNNIATETLKNQTQQIKNRTETLRLNAVEEAGEVERQGKIQDANRRIFSAVTGADRDVTTGFQNENIGAIDQALPNIDIESNLTAFKSIKNPTPDILNFISDMETAKKGGETSMLNPSDALQGLGSEEDTQSLFNMFESIPFDQQTPLTSGIAGAVSVTDGSGITEESRPLSLQEQEDNLYNIINSHPDFFLQDETARGKVVEQMMGTFVDPDAPRKALFDASNDMLDFRKKKAEALLAEAEVTASNNAIANPTIDFSLKDQLSLYSGRRELKDLNIVTSAIEKVRLSADPKNHTAGSDLSLIFAFMRILDPSSVVRESEFETAKSAQEKWKVYYEGKGLPIPEILKAKLAELTEGQMLLPSSRRDFLKQAENNYIGQTSSAVPYIRQAMELEKAGGHKQGHVVPGRHRNIVAEFDAREKTELEAGKEATTQVKTTSGLNVNVTVK